MTVILILIFIRVFFIKTKYFVIFFPDEPLMQAADSDGVLYKQLELETEIQKKIKTEIGRCASYWKQIEVQSL